MKKNIAIVITKMELGGAQKVALFLAKNLNKKRYNVYFITGPGGYLDNTIKEIKGIKVYFTKNLKQPVSPFFDILALFELKKFFKENKIDIVHTHSSKAGILGRFAAKMAGVKLIIHTIHGFPFHKYQNFFSFYIYLILEKIAAKFCHKLIAVGEDVMNYGLRYKVGGKKQYLIIRAGIDTNLFKKAKVNRKEYLKKYGINHKDFIVGMIGNLKKQKNSIEFINIACEVIKKGKNISFIFAGDGPLKSKANMLIKKLNLDEKVKFVGWVNEPEKFIKSLDIFLLTSLWEGLPCTLIQAIVAKKFCIATDINGNREIINKINCGFLYKPGDYKTAAEKILEIKDKKIKMPDNIYKTLKEFDENFMLKEYERVYKSVN